MKDYYCEICDKTDKNKSKTKHLKSKNHLHMKSYVREEHILGDVYWRDFYRVIREYVNNKRKKFPIFKTVVKCNLFYEDSVICYDKTKRGLIKFCFSDSVFHYFYPVCEEIQHRLLRYALIGGNGLSLDTLIKNMSGTFFSYYHIITPRHRLELPRRILESKLLKHITNLDDDDEKVIKYKFLWQIFKPINYDDIGVYFHLHR